LDSSSPGFLPALLAFAVNLDGDGALAVLFGYCPGNLVGDIP